jgi:4-alpha-glucanotransferase
MKIRFQIDYRTQWGQQLFICGSLPELGGWDVHRAPVMTHQSGGSWEFELTIPGIPPSGFQYKYFVRDTQGTEQWEMGNNRTFFPDVRKDANVIARDWWRTTSQEEAALYTSAFRDVLLRPHTGGAAAPTKKKSSKGKGSYRFQLQMPQVEPGSQLCIIGSDPALGSWDVKKALVMDGSCFPLWQAEVSLSNAEVVRYKYGIFDPKTKQIRQWESGDDRTLWLNPSPEVDQYIQTDENFRFTGSKWRGTGVAIPVFSLRTEQGTGVGEFLDLKALVDWSQKTGMKLVQILPVNDTVATHTWVDSYPYAAISVFALHPIYLNLEAMGTLKNKKDQKFYNDQRVALNKKDFVDYEAVMKVKSRYFKQLYDQEKKAFLADPAFQQFLADNRNWLQPYAVFSYLRDLNGTSEFDKWGEYARISPEQLDTLSSPDSPTFDDVAVHYFIQFHLDKQLLEAATYARERGVVLKGDIPIGIYRNSVDAWLTPELYHMNSQAGAPPDDFSATGQNWRFPTYNWERMAEDGYAWWQTRLQKMAAYFDVYRIDHILGFFRIWEIPYEGVDGLLGHFSPALPYSLNEMAQRGIWFDYERFCTPYIRDHMLWDLFGELRDEVVKTYLTEYQPGHFRLKPEVNTQRQVEELLVPSADEAPEARTKRERIKAGLFRLIGEVLFLEVPNSNGEAFNPRISFHQTYSYRELDGGQKHKLNELYIDYFYKRHEQFWRAQGLTKLPAIKNATDMLVCGEDLGMVPDVVPGVMHELGLLSLYIQRMPKDPKLEFGHPDHAPYLSVVTPSSHDMSTIRGWWEEDRDKTQRFYNHILGHHGEAPIYCEPWIAREIIVQHLYSPAMWAIFPIQDLVAMDARLRRKETQEERINVPANPQHFWKYRFHLNMENLLKEEEFNASLLEMSSQSGRKTQ